jgi:hypothetical protein
VLVLVLVLVRESITWSVRSCVYSMCSSHLVPRRTLARPNHFCEPTTCITDHCTTINRPLSTGLIHSACGFMSFTNCMFVFQSLGRPYLCLCMFLSRSCRLRDSIHQAGLPLCFFSLLPLCFFSRLPLSSSVHAQPFSHPSISVLLYRSI